MLERLLDEFAIEEIPFGEVHWRETVDAYRRYGKGRHAAALNFGDCMTYAVAKLAGEPLLFTGRDFALTDVYRA
jgi:ribonuclease VapC